jgi:hypothetical protein
VDREAVGTTASTTKADVLRESGQLRSTLAFGVEIPKRWRTTAVQNAGAGRRAHVATAFFGVRQSSGALDLKQRMRRS